jgi:hypothetical protein
MADEGVPTNLPWDLIRPWVDPIRLIHLNTGYRTRFYEEAIGGLTRTGQCRLGRALVRADAHLCLGDLCAIVRPVWRAPHLRLFRGRRYADYLTILQVYAMDCSSVRCLAVLREQGGSKKRYKTPKASQGKWRD